MIPQDADQLLLLFGALLLVAELSVVVVRFPEVGLWLFAGASVLGSFAIVGALSIAGYQVYVLDAVTVVLLGAMVFRRTPRRVVSRAIALLAALFVVGLLRGIAAYGTQQAVNDGRYLLYFITGLAYSTMCTGAVTRSVVQRIWKVLAVVLIVVAWVFIARNGFGTYASTGKRSLNAAQTLLVAQAGVMAMTGAGWRQRALALACLGTVVASQHRTVWAATVATVGVLVFAAGRFPQSLVRRRVRFFVFGAGILGAVLLSVGPTGLRDSASTAISSISAQTGTGGWRVESSSVLLRRYASGSLDGKVFGQPSGTGFARETAGNLWTASPHNMYVYLLISVGMAGLVALLVVYGAALRRAYLISPVLLALAAGLVVYGFGYQLPPEQALLLGAGLVLRVRAMATSRQLVPST